MSVLKLKGTVNIMDREVPNIEGGFGKGKKSMLAKDIAEFHDKEKRAVNQAINMNIDRFRPNIDVIDLKNRNDFVINLIDHEILSQNSVNRSSNIFLLSERGYAKLIKIFNDDLSWEMYDKLLDSYFDMREQQKEMNIENKFDAFEHQLQLMREQQKQINNNRSKIKNVKEEVEQITESNVPDDYISLIGLAKKLNLKTAKGNWHCHLAGAITRDAGLNVSEEAPYEDDHIKVVFGKGDVGSRVYLSPKAVNYIEVYWDRHKIGYKHKTYYENKSKYGYPGDVQAEGYKINNIFYKTYEARIGEKKVG